MHDQLTENDIQQMKEELDYRRITLRPKLLEEVKTARAFGDRRQSGRRTRTRAVSAIWKR